MTIIKISPSRDSKRRVYFNVMEKEDGKSSFPVWINEIVDGKPIPGHKGRMFLNGKDGGNRWFEISAPLRRTDLDGNYEYQPRKDSDGNFLNEKGNQVSEEKYAAKQYVYVTDNDNNIKYGLLAVINVINLKKDKNTGEQVPTKSTYLSVKMYTDQESYDMSKSLFEYQHSDSDQEKKSFLEDVNLRKKDSGEYTNMFVDSGSEHFKSLGFEFRSSNEGEGMEPK